MRSKRSYRRLFKRSFLPKKVLVVLMMPAFFFSFSVEAEASIFSFIKGLFKDSGREQAALILNSQTMPLLDAPTNINPLAGIGGGDITIVQNNALLPVMGPLGSMADIEESAKNSGQISIYTVRRGDNLSQIAKMFGVSVNTIIWANDLKRSDLIKTGQVLVILPVSGIKYSVKKGDTIAKIAKKFKGDADEIIQFNDLSASGSLGVGQTIIIPNGEGYLVPKSSRLVRGGGPSYTGYYIRPISGGRKSQRLHGYNAVDLANYCGASVMAAAAGDVIVSRTYGWNGGYGLYAVVRHPNGTQTLYAHLGSVLVQRGWHVVQGQVLGYMGSTGQSSGCHLHFELRGARNPF